MYQLKSLDDTIVAIATPLGQGGLGIIRLSGKEALLIADKMFKTKGKKRLSDFENFKVHYGWVVGPTEIIKGKKENNIIDEVLLTVMRSPKSYTKEDVVEISCHGGVVALRAILNLALDLGARLAEPGEFTKRAFLNGRIDLTQAEAVLDIIQSKTNAFLRASLNQLKGELSSELEAIREILMNVYTEIEAIINFPEDDLNAKNQKELLTAITISHKKIERLLQTTEHGKIIKEGIKIVICGRANVGKSSLLNVILKQPRAIVSDIAGTTRDTIEETAQIKGTPFQLIDTAGILEPRDLIEEEAVKRSHMYIQGADLVLFVLDANQNVTAEDKILMQKLQGKNLLVVINKSDLEKKIDIAEIKVSFKMENIIYISALKKIGMEELEEAILEKVWHGKDVDPQGVFISNIRHINALKSSLMSVEKSMEIISQKFSIEVASEEIKAAVNYLDAITGRNIDSDLLDNIFSQFCIGK